MLFVTLAHPDIRCEFQAGKTRKGKSMCQVRFSLKQENKSFLLHLIG